MPKRPESNDRVIATVPHEGTRIRGWTDEYMGRFVVARRGTRTVLSVEGTDYFLHPEMAEALATALSKSREDPS
jgi:hypothetical protein